MVYVCITALKRNLENFYNIIKNTFPSDNKSVKLYYPTTYENNTVTNRKTAYINKRLFFF